METIIKQLEKIRVDALYGKKKHFNAADRKEKYHYYIGVPLTFINLFTSTVLFFLLTDGLGGGWKYIPLILSLITTLLSGYQTFFNFQDKVEGHRKVANQYLAIMKKCDRLIDFAQGKHISENELINRIESVAVEMDNANRDAEKYSTNGKDYMLAKEGINIGEEVYTPNELNKATDN